MEKSIKNRLDALIFESKNMGSDDNALTNFATKWRTFLSELSADDKKIAVTAYFQGIDENLELAKKDAQFISKNGNENERQEYANELVKIKELLSPRKNKVGV